MTFEKPNNLSDPIGAPYRRVAHWMALGAAIFTLPLLYVGGSVTTYRVGLAVPDWPTTYGINMFLFNMWEHPFGVRIEHSHRLYGAAVGLFTLVLAGWLLLFEPRKWMKWLGLAAVATVIVQGVLGGTRVTQTSTILAAVHACVGQAFFALMVALCVFTGRRWQRPVGEPIESAWLTRLGWAIVALVPAQIMLGSWLRHFGTWQALLNHAFVAPVILVCCLFLAFVVEQHKANWGPLVPAARALGLMAAVQVGLGIGSFIALLPFDGLARTVTFYQAVTRTAHQTSGALLLAAAVVFQLRCFRHVTSSRRLIRNEEELVSCPEADPVALSRGALA